MMHAAGRLVLSVLLAVVSGILYGSRVVQASEPEVSLKVAPIRYIFVDGDSGTFREHHWMRDRYTGGISEFSGSYEFADGTRFKTDGHALIDQNDLGANVSFEKEGLGFFDIDFTEFRKYYSGKGGVYRRFGANTSPDTDKQLELDIGKLELETGLRLEGLPELTFLYEREYKDGTKSRLTWGEIEEAISGTDTTKNIVPSWQEIDEIVDVFALKASDEIAGWNLSGEQRWEFVRSESLRQELDISTTHGSGDDKLRRQDQAPESTLMTTLLGAQRSFQDGKTFIATAYRFGHMDNREFESIYESNSLTGVLTTYSNGEQKRNARSDNDYDTHTWVTSSAFRPLESLSFTTKIKTEVIKQEGNSSYPSDEDATPNGIIDRTEVNLNNTKAVRWGEGFSLRFTKIPRTALYTDLELEQARVLLREDRKSIDGPDAGDDSSATENFSRETVTAVRRGAWTLGANVAPWSYLNLTAQVRRRVNNSDYDDQRETVGSIRSAFLDGISVHTNEFVTRATYRPLRWLRSSFRYQYRSDDYSTWVQKLKRDKANAISHTYTYDAAFQPFHNLSLIGSFSRQTALTTTSARYGAGSTNTPAFHADVNSWLFSADYTVSPALVLTGNLQHSRARNFNDFTAAGLPLGADFDKIDLTTGLKWSVSEDASVDAEYGFYHYQPNSNWSAGDYDAHLISLEVSKKF